MALFSYELDSYSKTSDSNRYTNALRSKRAGAGRRRQQFEQNTNTNGRFTGI
jgi:hypothetical protein